MNKSLISSVAAAALVGSIGLVYAQTQSSDATATPSAGTSTQAATIDNTTPSSSSTMPSSTIDNSTNNSTSNSTSNSTTDDSTLAAQADRN